VIRVATFVAGLAAAAYGIRFLLERGWANLEAALTWLVAGVVLHDAVLAPVVLGVAWGAQRLLGRRRLGPWAVGLVLLGPLTLLAVSVLGRFGARADNPTLLDRNYWGGWSLVVVAVCIGILVGWYAGRRGRARTQGIAPRPVEGGVVDGPGHGGR
jgi:hypothetical protein